MRQNTGRDSYALDNAFVLIDGFTPLTMSKSTVSIIVFALMIAVIAYSARGRTRGLTAIAVRDWAIYLGISLLLVIGVILYAVYGPN